MRIYSKEQWGRYLLEKEDGETSTEPLKFFLAFWYTCSIRGQDF